MKISLWFLVVFLYQYGWLPSTSAFDTSFCAETARAFNSTSFYLKSLCMVNTPRIYSDAVAFCESKGMKIFKQNSVAEVSKVMTLVNSFYNGDASSAAFIWNDRLPPSTFCQVITGNGISTGKPCSESRDFVCQYQDPTYIPINFGICTNILAVLHPVNIYEKTFCYVKNMKTWDEASLFCQINGMKMFNIFSSSYAETRIVNFVPGVYIDGKKGNLCLTVSAQAKAQYSPCTQPREFICEYIIENANMVYPTPSPTEVYRFEQSLDYSTCHWSSEVYSKTFIFEKRLCYISIPSTYSDAIRHCASIGMNLYDVFSSPDAMRIASQTKEYTNFENFVKGKSEQSCLVINHDGVLEYTTCNVLRSFFCENFNDGLTTEVRTRTTTTTVKIPQLCTKTDKIFKANGVYEKSLCYVKSKKTRINALKFCQQNKMQLYNAYSSRASESKISLFVAALYKGSSTLSLFVDGRLFGLCRVFNGKGASVFRSCSESREFVCEFKEKVTGVDLLPLPGVCGISTENKIVGGVRVGLKEFPWLARVYHTNGRCTGALINYRYVMSATHCGNGKTVVLGEWDTSKTKDCIGFVCNPPVVMVKVIETIFHSGYQPTPFFNDISLLRLEKEIEFTVNIRPLCLPIDQALRDLDLIGKVGIAAGWGMTALNASASPVLLKAELDVKPICRNDKIQICASRVGKSTCRGDSGGSFMRRNLAAIPPYWYSIGVVAASFCSFTGQRVTFTRVSYFMPWIIENLKP